MKKPEVVVGQVYLAKVSGTLQRVKIDRCGYVQSRISGGHLAGNAEPRWRGITRWYATNLKTGRTIVVKSAQRLRPICGCTDLRCPGCNAPRTDKERRFPFHFAN